MIPLYIIKGEKRRPGQAGTPGSAHAAPVRPEPAAGQPGKRKSRRSREEIGSSVKVVDPHRKVAKSFGRKS